MPPALAGAIDYDPPAARRARPAHPAPAPGTLTKVAAVYDRPFWRDDGLNGHRRSLNGPVNADLRRLARGRHARASSSASSAATRRAPSRARAERRDGRARRASPNSFGPQAARPTHYFETDWPGALVARRPGRDPRPGRAARLRPRPARAGRPHPLGRHRDVQYWNGYMDGAVRSGERAAEEVLDAL